jgi:transcriptional regulator with XRE-family HTH domain
MEMNKKELLRQTALKLKKLREQWGYGLKGMAAYLGISREGYSKNENGETFPGTKTLFRLSKDHDISMDWLMFDKGPMHFKEKEKMAVLESKAAELEQELKKERDNVRRLEREKESVEHKNKELEKELAKKNPAMEISPEMKELLEHMQKIPLLYHEVLAGFQEFKWDRREMVETFLAQAESPGNR